MTYIKTIVNQKNIIVFKCLENISGLDHYSISAKRGLSFANVRYPSIVSLSRLRVLSPKMHFFQKSFASNIFL